MQLTMFAEWSIFLPRTMRSGAFWESFSKRPSRATVDGRWLPARAVAWRVLDAQYFGCPTPPPCSLSQVLETVDPQRFFLTACAGYAPDRQSAARQVLTPLQAALEIGGYSTDDIR